MGTRWKARRLGAIALLPLLGCAAAGPAASAGTTPAGTVSSSGNASDPTTSERPLDTTAASGAPTSAPGADAVPLVGGGTLDLASLSDLPLALWFWAPG